MNAFNMGAIGLAAQAGMNLVAMLVFEQASAGFLAEQWWSSWFPTYGVWSVFLVAGWASRSKKNDA